MQSLRALLIATLLMIPAGTAAAADFGGQESEAEAQSNWEAEVSLYLFMAGLKGNVAVSPALPTASVDASFSDILDNLRFALAGTAEVRNGTYFGYTDLNYISLQIKNGTPGPVINSITVDAKTFWMTAVGGYTVHQTPRGYVDVFAGGRVWNVDTTLNVNFSRRPNRSRNISEWWFDPVIGVKGKFNFADNWYAAGYGDIGGFGVGSDLTFQLYGGIGWKATDAISLELGYRHLDVDYANKGFVWDVGLSGPQASVKIKF